jgi:hypothetical protein
VECPSDIIDQIGGWATGSVGQGYASRIQPVDVAAIIDCFKPKSSLLSEISERGVPGPYAPRVALYTFISTAAGRSVSGYTRECTTLLVTNKKTKGKKFQ